VLVVETLPPSDGCRDLRSSRAVAHRKLPGRSSGRTAGAPEGVVPGHTPCTSRGPIGHVRATIAELLKRPNSAPQPAPSRCPEKPALPRTRHIGGRCGPRPCRGR